MRAASINRNNGDTTISIFFILCNTRVNKLLCKAMRRFRNGRVSDVKLLLTVASVSVTSMKPNALTKAYRENNKWNNRLSN